MRLPEWTWHWAWTAFLRWALRPALASPLSVRQRWQVVLWSLRPGIKYHYLSPTTAWLHRHSPTGALLLRLHRQGGSWYRVPSMAVAVHLWRRLGVHVLEGDFVKIEKGAVTMTGSVDEDARICELWWIGQDA